MDDKQFEALIEKRLDALPEKQRAAILDNDASWNTFLDESISVAEEFSKGINDVVGADGKILAGYDKQEIPASARRSLQNAFENQADLERVNQEVLSPIGYSLAGKGADDRYFVRNSNTGKLSVVDEPGWELQDLTDIGTSGLQAVGTGFGSTLGAIGGGGIGTFAAPGAGTFIGAAAGGTAGGAAARTGVDKALSLLFGKKMDFEQSAQQGAIDGALDVATAGALKGAGKVFNRLSPTGRAVNEFASASKGAALGQRDGMITSARRLNYALRAPDDKSAKLMDQGLMDGSLTLTKRMEDQGLFTGVQNTRPDIANFLKRNGDDIINSKVNVEGVLTDHGLKHYLDGTVDEVGKIKEVSEGALKIAGRVYNKARSTLKDQLTYDEAPKLNQLVESIRSRVIDAGDDLMTENADDILKKSTKFLGKKFNSIKEDAIENFPKYKEQVLDYEKLVDIDIPTLEERIASATGDELSRLSGELTDLETKQEVLKELVDNPPLTYEKLNNIRTTDAAANKPGIFKANSDVLEYIARHDALDGIEKGVLDKIRGKLAGGLQDGKTLQILDDLNIANELWSTYKPIQHEIRKAASSAKSIEVSRKATGPVDAVLNKGEDLVRKYFGTSSDSVTVARRNILNEAKMARLQNLTESGARLSPSDLTQVANPPGNVVGRGIGQAVYAGEKATRWVADKAGLSQNLQKALTSNPAYQDPQFQAVARDLMVSLANDPEEIFANTLGMFLGEFPDIAYQNFAPGVSGYPSEVNGKIRHPKDKMKAIQDINSSEDSLTRKAKRLSAMNKDGTYLR